MLKIVLRADDIGWSPDAIGDGPEKQPDRGLELAQRFHAAMQGRPYLGAVIPASLDDEGRSWLQSHPEGLTIAAHGTTHQMSRDRVADEYHDVRDLSSLRDRIETGLRLLGLSTREHFVPPFNACGSLLPEALYLEGFRWIWGAPSLWPTPPQPYSMGRMGFVPAWAKLYSSTRWRMREGDVPLLQAWPMVRDLPGQACLVMHLPWEFAHGPDLNGVNRLMDMLGDAVISPQEFVGNV